MRRAMVLLPLGLLILAASLSVRPAGAQGGGAAEEVHYGAGSCSAQACHGGGAGDAPAWQRAYKVWATNDKHSKAYALLSNDLGRRIGERLGIDPVRAPECLTCHGTTGVATAKTFDPADGVSCELCHGGAKDWLGPHAAPDWKDRAPAGKAKAGFRDLTTPKARVAACVRCHVAGEQRDITHDIMAAGHPPLSFDAAKYMHDMPPHWEDEEDLTIPTWVEGLKANAVAQLRHVARAADDKTRWPEFAVFDCYSCHHPIYTGSVYERADPLGRPGDLPLDLSSLRVLLTATGNEALAKDMKELLAKTYRPGDDGRPLAIFAANAAKAVEALFPDAARYGRAEADRYLANLDAHLVAVAAGGTRTTRFEMQQIAAAIHSLSRGGPVRAGRRGGRADPEFAAAYRSLDEALDLARPYDAAACAALARTAISAGR